MFDDFCMMVYSFENRQRLTPSFWLLQSLIVLPAPFRPARWMLTHFTGLPLRAWP